MSGVLTRLIDALTPAPASRQIQAEFRPFLDTLKEAGVTSYLEVGAYRGGTFYHVMRSLSPGAFGVTVDDGGRMSKKGRPSPLAVVGARLARQGYRIETVSGDSHAAATIEATRRLGPFDAILIDGDHSYEGVLADWQAYGPMATKLVAFHDIAINHLYRDGGKVEVARLWREIKNTGVEAREFIAPGSKRGIGLVVR